MSSHERGFHDLDEKQIDGLDLKRGAPMAARCSAHFRQGDIEAICEERAGHEAEFGRTENEHHGYLTGPGWRISIDWWAES